MNGTALYQSVATVFLDPGRRSNTRHEQNRDKRDRRSCNMRIDGALD
jgi:hypothetical protein